MKLAASFSGACLTLGCHPWPPLALDQLFSSAQTKCIIIILIAVVSLSVNLGCSFDLKLFIGFFVSAKKGIYLNL